MAMSKILEQCHYCGSGIIQTASMYHLTTLNITSAEVASPIYDLHAEYG